MVVVVVVADVVVVVVIIPPLAALQYCLDESCHVGVLGGGGRG